MTCVLDASTLLKSAMAAETEEGARAARAIQPPLAEKFGFHAPDLIAWEVANVIHHKDRGGKADDAEQRARLAEVLLSVIERVPSWRIDWDSVAALAQDHDLTAYDASYLSLAVDDPDGLLVTEDEGLLEAARSEIGVDRAHRAVTALRYVDDGLL